ncbi:cation transporter [Streptomyces olivochromogenes]|uniref:Membrane protein n=1 Tax=Streptomyces olivochromogenes TaxID=1963 RepID=A0A250V5W8_STROL|nr:cation transporter [Streptomyces olivochromogenes]KUN49926.1 hypothetical protein AQJ27_00845 [Streptomyces olivochromogenes]GAX49555.1 membrane protein [Streptomyces olivochromogenes]
MNRKPNKSDRRTRLTVLVALGANLLIAVAKAVGGLLAGSPALLSEAAHSVADSVNEVFLGRGADEEASRRIRALLEAQPEIDSVEALLTMQLGLDSTLVAARIDLVPGLDGEEVEEVAVRIKRSVAHTVPEADQIFLDVTDAGAAQTAARGKVTAESPAATGERGGA